MPTILDSRGKRIIIRHRGPAGAGLPLGGTAGQIPAKASSTDHDVVWVDPPDGVDGVTSTTNSTVDGELAVFDGVTGKVIRGSAVPLTSVARVVQLDGKVDKVAGKGLSTNDLTTALFDKLVTMDPATYQGHFSSFANLTSEPIPNLSEGDYATVASGLDIIVHWYVDSVWQANTVPQLTGQQIADLIFNETATWTLADSVVFTEDDKTRLDAAVTEEQLQTIAQQAGVVPPSYGALSFFGPAAPFTVAIAASSDGTNNFAHVAATTVFASALSGFSNNGSDNGQIHYIATQSPRICKISGNITVSSAAADRVVVALFRNGSAIESSSRSIVEVKSTGALSNVSFEAFISLATSDFVDVRVANLDSAGDIVVHALSLDAVSL